MEHLKKVPSLRALHLQRVGKNEGMAALVELPNLAVLDLFRSDVTDPGMEKDTLKWQTDIYFPI